MSALDNYPALRFEIVLKNIAGSGVTVLATAAYEADATTIARAIGRKYIAGAVAVREVKP